MAEAGTHGSNRPADAANANAFRGFERILPENCVEYVLFILETDLEPRKNFSNLEAVRKAAVQLSSQLTKDYIWQREEFNLEIKSTDGTPCLVSAPSSHAMN